MSDETKNQEVNEIEDLAVSPINDEDLDSVAGGARALEDGCTGCVETGCCSTGGASSLE